MPELPRRRSTDAREECWHVYYGDVQAGTIVIRSGNPHDEDPGEWRCGLYPGSHPGEHQDGTAASFEEARADFEEAWQFFLAKRSEADVQAWPARLDRSKICDAASRRKTTIAETKYADEVRMRPRFIQWRQKSTSTPGP
jgi:hypothetical protein